MKINAAGDPLALSIRRFPTVISKWQARGRAIADDDDHKGDKDDGGEKSGESSDDPNDGDSKSGESSETAER